MNMVFYKPIKNRTKVVYKCSTRTCRKGQKIYVKFL